MLLAACGLVVIVPGHTIEPLDQFPLESVVIAARDRSYSFTVWVAATDARRSQGLMRVGRLDAGRGMLFLFDAPTRPAMWMKNMTIPLDLLFISADGTLLAVACDITPDFPRTIQPDHPISAVIELPGGTVERLKIETGATTARKSL